ncbi:MAG: hypothetical protein LH475_04715 [Cryobacterium sp.]|uniref:hypothetical protein n=1 Tax=unclassified Cryobacterium TaxID=2649013 RepID=UPI0018C9985D|nr:MULTISPECIES: hypothetical protein [unclassified Cryobacterium]MCY7403921.1 hypothetical protein [Cryobacterium sp.]MEC5153693.1 hypothetical protein [Cryobacterium sp. CAN_C3]
MTHAHPLHVDLEVACLCCLAPQPFHFTSLSDQVVCTLCVHHLSAEKSERRDLEHVRLWAARWAAAETAHQGYITETDALLVARDTDLTALRDQVVELSALVAGQFSAGIDGVRGLLQNNLVKRAERNTELAHRQIDWAMAGLWRMDALHHDDPARPTKCSCGRTAGTCAESAAIDSLRQALRDWEKKNVVLLQGGRRHGLPSDHPAVLAQRMR